MFVTNSRKGHGKRRKGKINVGHERHDNWDHNKVAAFIWSKHVE
jgi:hypothetical protein